MIDNKCRRVQLAIKMIVGPIRCRSVLIRYVCFLVPAWLSGLLYCGQAGAAPALQIQSGVVTRVVDGDTVWVKTSVAAHPLKVRISGIDAPEICQAGGGDARDALKQRVLGQLVTISFKQYDSYGRALASVAWHGEDIGRWMVVNGYAWSYRFRRSAGPYAAEQSQAVQLKRGIFGMGGAQNPRTFRKRHGSCYS